MSEQDEEDDIVRVHLTFTDAMSRAAKQNFDKDVRHNKVCAAAWDSVQQEYLSEARALLLRDGENTRPEFPDTEHIVLLKKKKK